MRSNYTLSRRCMARGVLIAVAMIGIQNSPSDAQQVTWGQISALLDKGMTEQEVIQAVGYRPTKVELQTCGQDTTGGAWSCKIYTFGNMYENLRIYFHEGTRGWLVNGWSVFA